MKKLILFILVILLVAGAVLYANPDWQAYLLRKRDDVMDKVQTTTLYKWQDGDGQWQVSSEKPPPGTEFEILEYQHDTNVMPRKALTGKEE